MRKVRVVFVFALILGLVIGISIATRFNLSPSTIAEEGITGQPAVNAAHASSVGPGALDDNAFIDVSERVGPAVVSISTEHIRKVRATFRRSPFGNDDFFDGFFNDFFGDMPEREFKQRGLGSGVIIDEAGYILTNEHVIEDADKITVTLPDGREFKGELRGKDVRSDLAVIKISGEGLPVAELGDSDKVKTGQWAIAIGNPFGFAVQNPHPTITVGIVSALDRSLPRVRGRDRDYTGLIQTDAAINPGNSGGPLVNIKGAVIGINVAIFTTSGGYQGIGFAIPINNAKEIIGTLIKGKKVLYGWLGVNVQEVDEKLAKYFRLPDTNGVLIAKVLKGSPAEKGGLRPEDIIRAFGGKEIRGLKSLLKAVARARVGSRVRIGIMREGKPLTVVVEIAARPSDASAIEELKKVSEENWRGLEVKEITKELERRYRIRQDAGVFVSGVERASAADEAGIVIGDIIDRINNEDIENISDYNRVTSSIKGDALVRTARGYAVIKEALSKQ